MKESGKSPIAVAAVVVVLLLLPIAYVLSSGPALMLLGQGRLSNATWETIYYPLRCDLGPLDPPLIWYWEQWAGGPGLPTLVVDPEA
jgi:hypothetical protein